MSDMTNSPHPRRSEPTKARPMIRRAGNASSESASTNATATTPVATTAVANVHSDASTNATAATREGAHRLSVEIDDTALVIALTDLLGSATLCALVTKDKSSLSRWRSGAHIPTQHSQKLRSVYEIFSWLSFHESATTVKNWFVATNPTLGNRSPIEALTGGDFDATYAAATTFVDSRVAHE